MIPSSKLKTILDKPVSRAIKLLEIEKLVDDDLRKPDPNCKICKGSGQDTRITGFTGVCECLKQ